MGIQPSPFVGLSTFWTKWWRWFEETLPDYSAEQLVEKFKEESQEFLDNPCAEEAVDCMGVLTAWVLKSGNDLMHELWAKYRKVQSRKWERMPNGTYHHIKGT